MKKQFIEYHITEHLEKIYKDAIIVLDTNALINLYRYSKETREKYFEILEKVKDRLHLTHHISSEFYKNRYSLIKNRSIFKIKLKEFAEEYHNKIINTLKNSNSIPKYKDVQSILKHEEDLKNKIIKEIDKSFKKINKTIENFEDDIDFNFVLGTDPILAKVIEIFTDKISQEISDNQKEDLYKKGRQRYKQEIPPGYKDDKTKDEPEKFGDYIIWNELFEISKENEKDILFISDDRKEDWVVKFEGNDLGPRKELIKEFYKNTNNLFYSVSTKMFIKKISKIYNIENTEVLEKETETIDNIKIKDDKLTIINQRDNFYSSDGQLIDINREQEYIDWNKQHLINNDELHYLKINKKDPYIIKNELGNNIINYKDIEYRHVNPLHYFYGEKTNEILKDSNKKKE